MSNPVLSLQPPRQTPLRQMPLTAQAGQAGQARQAGQAGQTRAAIAQAAQRTGVDFSYLLAQAEIESGMNPSAQARTSSATGLYQFIDQTWLATMDKHGAQLGYGEMAQAISTVNGRAQITDPSMRDTIMGLRNDPQAAALMAGALATDNRAALSPALGREPDASELYLAHFLGADGANRFLSTLSASPNMSAAVILPQAARANRAIFYDAAGAPNSVSEVMELVRGKVTRAMESGGVAAGGILAGEATNLPNSGWYPVQDAAAPNSARRVSALPVLPSLPSLSAMRALPSMAETLRSSFDLSASGTSVPGQTHVRNAYAKLEAFGL